MSVPFTAEQIDEMIMVKLRMLRAEIDTERAQAATAAQTAATQATNELGGMFGRSFSLSSAYPSYMVAQPLSIH